MTVADLKEVLENQEPDMDVFIVNKDGDIFTIDDIVLKTSLLNNDEGENCIDIIIE